MKVSRQLDRLEPMVLVPLHGVSGDDWHKAPRGKWTLAQILQHLAIGVDVVGTTLEQRADKHMCRRAKPHQTVLRHLILGLGAIPGGLKAPAVTKPEDQPDPELIAAQFRMGVEKLRELAGTWPKDLQLNRYVGHPFLGDLNLPEWVRFHYLHCRHHAKQLRDRVSWIRRRTGSG